MQSKQIIKNQLYPKRINVLTMNHSTGYIIVYDSVTHKKGDKIIIHFHDENGNQCLRNAIFKEYL